MENLETISQDTIETVAPKIELSLGGAIVKFVVDVLQDGKVVNQQMYPKEYVVLLPVDVGLRQALAQFQRDLSTEVK